MKETKKNKIYRTPQITVVAFKVENGFASFKAESVSSPDNTSQTIFGIEKVATDQDLDGYFR